MSKNTLVQLRTNSNFTVNYTDLSLSPEVELIMLFVQPAYQLTTDSKIEKGHDLKEFRIKTDIPGITKMIGELQALKVQLQVFEDLSEGINAIVKQNIVPIEKVERPDVSPTNE